MALTTETDSTATAIVTVRVPRDSDVDLTTDAERRIARTEGISDVSVDQLRGIEPRLAATFATVRVTVQTSGTRTVEDRLTDATGIEAVDLFE